MDRDHLNSLTMRFVRFSASLSEGPAKRLAGRAISTCNRARIALDKGRADVAATIISHLPAIGRAYKEVSR